MNEALRQLLPLETIQKIKRKQNFIEISPGAPGCIMSFPQGYIDGDSHPSSFSSKSKDEGEASEFDNFDVNQEGLVNDASRDGDVEVAEYTGRDHDSYS